MKYLFYALFLVFVVMIWKRIKSSPPRFASAAQTVVFGFASLLFFIFNAKIPFVKKDIDLILMSYLFVFLRQMFLFLAVFGTRFVKKFYFELAQMFLFLVPFMLAPLLIDHFWMYSSKIAFFGLRVLLPIFRVPYELHPEILGIDVKNFSVVIGPSCAGLNSLLAFLVLYSTAVVLASRQAAIHAMRAILFLFFGLFLVLFLNSLRIALILLIGAYISQDFALNLFHNYIGSLLLIGFFMAYLSLTLPKLFNRHKA